MRLPEIQIPGPLSATVGYCIRLATTSLPVSIDMRLLALAFVLAGVIRQPLCAADWHQFRGPKGQGHADAPELPTRWSETENVAWKVAIPGQGHSSPIVVEDQVWLTSAQEKGRSLRAICVNRTSGDIVHNRELFRLEESGPTHGKNSHATPTPLFENDRVYIHFGQRGTACLSTAGDVIWKSVILEYDQPYGGASTPILFENLLILTCDGNDSQFLAALNKQTGEVVWRTVRTHFKEREKPIPLMSYSTPLVVNVGGVPQVVSSAADHAAAYDARTGREIWGVRYDGFSEVVRPVTWRGLVILQGFENMSEVKLYAIRPDGEGEITKTHVEWKLDRGAPHVPSPLVVGDELYIINDGGVSICLDAKTGKEHWTARVGGNHSASPLYGGGKIYCFNEEGESAVLAPGKKFQLLAKNELAEGVMASPAAAGRALYIRTRSHLYRIEKQ